MTSLLIKIEAHKSQTFQSRFDFGSILILTISVVDGGSPGLVTKPNAEVDRY